jgi:hypothetical protein
MIQNNNKMATILSLFVSVFLVILGTASAKRYGGGGGGRYGGGFSSSKGTTAATNMGGFKTPGSMGPVSYSRPIRSNGGGYASSTRNQPYNRYPNSGYGPSMYGGFFLGSSYRRSQYGNNRSNTTSNNNNNSDDDYDTYFDRIENGCELTGVDSYRTIDTSNNATSIWTGCSEEWRYNIGLVKTMWSSSSSSLSSSNTPSIASNFTFISPPLELYACSENDSCSACEDELKGKEFDALTLEVLDYPNMAYPIDCYVPKNLSLVQENFNCVNDECIFLSEKYDYLSSDAAANIITTTSTTTFFWTVLASSGIGMTLLL